jgi:hypothetical protein
LAPQNGRLEMGAGNIFVMRFKVICGRPVVRYDF